MQNKLFINGMRRNVILNFIGPVVGAIAGYTYYFFIGCASGHCPITSNPFISTGYGAIMGYLFFSLFKKETTAHE